MYGGRAKGELRLRGPFKTATIPTARNTDRKDFSSAAFCTIYLLETNCTQLLEMIRGVYNPPCAPHSHLLDTQLHLILCKVTHEPYCSVTSCFWLSRTCQPWILITSSNLLVYIFPLILLVLLCVVSTWFSGG